jgi:hypothetical protein
MTRLKTALQVAHEQAGQLSTATDIDTCPATEQQQQQQQQPAMQQGQQQLVEQQQQHQQQQVADGGCGANSS